MYCQQQAVKATDMMDMFTAWRCQRLGLTEV